MILKSGGREEETVLRVRRELRRLCDRLRVRWVTTNEGVV
jgi:hypothetical protein